MTTIFDLAKTRIETTPQWSSGHSVTIWESATVKVNVEAGPTNSGRLDLVLYNGKRTRVTAGYLSLRNGWTFSLTRADYAAWVEKCGGKTN